MSARIPTLAALSKDTSRPALESKPVSLTTTAAASPKLPAPATKAAVSKAIPKTEPKEMSPPGEERTELLGSLTTQQQQRTSARVIKKLKLEPQPEKKAKRTDGASDEIPECDTPKIEDKELKFPTVKQRMPKALWSTDEKNLFFEALNEYGKDFDAITAHICAKMKKKGMPDQNLKTKTQVSHFYYRTWHKLSKHVHFDENVKKVAQELYALINYGELRKKLTSVNEKTCGRLGEMVLRGGIMVRARGRNLRVRTPMCRALRRLNQITERACGSRVCARAAVWLAARDAAAWARVQAAAHNPRACVMLAPRTRLRALLHALQRRWRPYPGYKQKLADGEESQEVDRSSLNHLQLEPDRIIAQEDKLPKKLALHVGPRPGAEIHLPVVTPSEQLSSQKICFSSYLERMGQRQRDEGTKIRTPKRQRKDSATEKDKDVDQKKIKLDEESKLIIIEETAIDGIELMASYKHNQEDERPSTEDEKDGREDAELRGVATEEEIDKDDVIREREDLKDKDDAAREREDAVRDRDMSEREKDSLSEMEDDEKYNKSDTDNESDGKSGKERKFKNLKVKFRIRPKKRGGSVYTLVTDDDKDDCKDEKPDIDVELALKQIRDGWSAHDAGDLTIGDLYLMFGNRSKLELDYWWAEATPPLPEATPPLPQKPKLEPDKKADKTPDKTDSSVEDDKGEKSDTDIFSPKNTFSQDSNDGMSGDERKSELLASPDHKASSSTLQLVSKLINRPQPPPPPPSSQGLSQLGDRLKRLLSLAGNPHTGPAGAVCRCGHTCPSVRRPRPAPAPSEPVFRHPPPIAPREHIECGSPLDLSGLPRVRRGRPRAADRRVVVQRLLPLLPKLPPPIPLLPVKTVPTSPPAPPRILPKPPPTSTSDLSFFYVLSESNGQFFFHDGDRRIPITQPLNGADQPETETLVPEDEEESEVEMKVEEANSVAGEASGSVKGEPESEVEKPDIGSFLPAESLSLSPSRLLRDAEGWLEGSVHDFSLSSFLGHLEGPGRPQPGLAVDSHLHSLLAESSVDYVAKFADLAAEVADDADSVPTDELT